VEGKMEPSHAKGWRRVTFTIHDFQFSILTSLHVLTERGWRGKH
jgi:hypothetical protein